MKNTTKTKRTNRFFARNLKRAALAPRSPRVAIAAPEIDALESRLLLSGIVAGKDYKKLSYVDFDGDKVSISMKKGTFQVEGVFDGKTVLSLDALKVTSGDASDVLRIAVAKVKPTGDGTGLTNIGVIDTNGAALRGIQLDGAVVDSTDASKSSLKFITLQAKAAMQLDRNSAGGFGATALVNFGTITAQSLDLVQAASAPRSLATNLPLLNLNGPVTVAEGTTNVVARTGAVNGALNVNTLGNLNVLQLNGALTTVGNLTLNLANGASISGANINVGGDLHLTVLSGGLFGTTFNVVGSISGGDTKVTNDAVSVAGGVTYANFNAGQGGSGAFAGLTVVGGNIYGSNINTPDSIGAITANQGFANFYALTAQSIGDITVRDGFSTAYFGGVTATTGNIGNISAQSITGGPIQAVLGSVGDLTSTKGDISTNVTAAISIGNVTSAGTVGNLTAGVAETAKDAATGGDIGNIIAKGNVGNIKSFAGTVGGISVTGGNVGNIDIGVGNGTFAAVGGDLGKVTIVGGGLGTVNVLKGGIGDISITNGNLNNAINVGSGAVGKFELAGGNIGNIAVTTNAGQAIYNTITVLNGSIGNITAITSDANTFGMSATITAKTSIGNIDAQGTGSKSVGILGGTGIYAATIGTINAVGTETKAGDGDAVAIGGAISIGSATATTGTASIGNITITGSVGGALTLSARAPGGGFAGGTIGDVTMTSNDGKADNLTVNLVNVIKAGSVSLTGGTGLLTIDHSAAIPAVSLTQIGNLTSTEALTLTAGFAASKVATFGDVSVGKALNTNGSFASAISIGKFSVGSVADVGNFGTGGASKIGFITIGDSASAGNITFSFGDYNGQTGSTATVVGTVTTAGAPPTVTNLTTAAMIAAAPAGQNPGGGNFFFIRA